MGRAEVGLTRPLKTDRAGGRLPYSRLQPTRTQDSQQSGRHTETSHDTIGRFEQDILAHPFTPSHHHSASTCEPSEMPGHARHLGVTAFMSDQLRSARAGRSVDDESVLDGVLSMLELFELLELVFEFMPELVFAPLSGEVVPLGLVAGWVLFIPADGLGDV
jgi:hypothetical protein